MNTALLDRVTQMRDRIIEVRRDVHAHPELGFQEKRTSRLIAERLREAGVDVQEGVAGTGVVGIIKGAYPGPTLLVRADIDALPIQETSDVPYRSTNPGLMHACGHDGHVAIGLALAELLAADRELFAGTVKVVFQPAEENIGGAKPMIDAGVMENPKVDAAMSFHIWNDLPVGKIGVRPGPVFASADEFDLVIRGTGGHGASPHQGVDAITTSAQVITALQTVVSRETSPLEPAVLSIGTIHGGTAFNIIADEVRMAGTVRAFSEEVRSRILSRLVEISRGVASSMRATAEVSLKQGCPPVVNHPAVTEVVRKAAVSVVGPDDVVSQELTTGADDASYFLAAVPGCYFQVGAANSKKGVGSPHHTSTFDFDEEALVLGTKVLYQSVIDYLKPAV